MAQLRFGGTSADCTEDQHVLWVFLYRWHIISILASGTWNTPNWFQWKCFQCNVLLLFNKTWSLFKYYRLDTSANDNYFYCSWYFMPSFHCMSWFIWQDIIPNYGPVTVPGYMDRNSVPPVCNVNKARRLPVVLWRRFGRGQRVGTRLITFSDKMRREEWLLPQFIPPTDG